MSGLAVMLSIVRGIEIAQVQLGDQVDPGQPFMMIVDPDGIQVRATASQVVSEEMHLGQLASVTFDAFPGLKLNARLSNIGAIAIPGTTQNYYLRNVPVYLTLLDRDSRVIPDLTTSSDVVVGQTDNALLIPRSAAESKKWQMVRPREAGRKVRIPRGQAGNHRQCPCRGSRRPARRRGGCGRSGVKRPLTGVQLKIYVGNSKFESCSAAARARRAHRAAAQGRKIVWMAGRARVGPDCWWRRMAAYKFAAKPAPPAAAAQVAASRTATVTSGSIKRVLRLTGSTSAKNFRSVAAPLLVGPDAGRSLVLIYVAPSGAMVKQGDVVAEIDAQAMKDHVDDLDDQIAALDSQMTSRKAPRL